MQMHGDKIIDSDACPLPTVGPTSLLRVPTDSGLQPQPSRLRAPWHYATCAVSLQGPLLESQQEAGDSGRLVARALPTHLPQAPSSRSPPEPSRLGGVPQLLLPVATWTSTRTSDQVQPCVGSQQLLVSAIHGLPHCCTVMQPGSDNCPARCYVAEPCLLQCSSRCGRLYMSQFILHLMS